MDLWCCFVYGFVFVCSVQTSLATSAFDVMLSGSRSLASTPLQKFVNIVESLIVSVQSIRSLNIYEDRYKEVEASPSPVPSKLCVSLLCLVLVSVLVSRSRSCVSRQSMVPSLFPLPSSGVPRLPTSPMATAQLATLISHMPATSARINAGGRNPLCARHASTRHATYDVTPDDSRTFPSFRLPSLRLLGFARAE